jgi:8-hydroxy-5-deazaflavin:NADPH oxidoreductase
MRISIIGTGNMGRAIGARALAGGHDVTVVGKDEDHAREAVATLEALDGGGSVTGAVDGDALDGDVVVLAVYYPDARAAVESNAAQLAGKTVVDITNPLNDSFDALVVPPDSSATQELAGLAEDANFVKAFNTTFANTLHSGEVAGQPLDVFMAGDDEGAKAAVATLVRDGGLNPIDVGSLQRARDLEALGLLHITLQSTLGTGYASALKVLA